MRRSVFMSTHESRFTEQQQAAIERRKISLALSAGAGCGKTFVLTHRFLKHLEPPASSDRLHALVAITFTERAAREMRDRIREECRRRLATCTTAEMAHWHQVLRGLDAARIGTIHSFCAALLRSHAVEAALDPQFRLLEPPLADSLLQKTTTTVVHQKLIAEDPHATVFVLHFGLRGTCRLVASLTRQKYSTTDHDWQSLTSAELCQRWLTFWHDEFFPAALRRFRETEAVQQVLSLSGQLSAPPAKVRERLHEIAELLEIGQLGIDELRKLHELAKVQGLVSAKNFQRGEDYETLKQAFTSLRDQLKLLLGCVQLAQQDHSLAAEFALSGAHLAESCAAAYQVAKRKGGLLDFDDLLLQAHRLLRTHESVRRKLAAGIELLMVDEFQDTDPIQAEIVRFLCGEALDAGRLFVVGDPKQSIYRFRRADPQVFQTLSEQLPAQGRLSLTENFRSQPAILNFVNFLFGPAFPQYEPLTTQTSQLSPLPCVEFLWATHDVSSGGSWYAGEESADEEQEDAEDAAPERKVSQAWLRRREAEWMARRIAELLNDPTPRVRSQPRTSDLRRVEPGDIVILFRALTDVAVYEAALRAYGIEYYLVGGKAFYAQQEVFDLLNLCRCLDDPTDSAALVGVLRSPWFGCSDDAVHALCPPSGDWLTALQQPPPAYLPDTQQERLKFAGRVISELRRNKDRLSIVELLNLAVELTGYDAALLAEHLGRRKVANLRKLIASAAAFDRSELFTLKDYVQRLQASVFEQIDEEFATTQPEAGNVVRMMSIHQAKGLEFPVVFVADANRACQTRTPRAVWHDQWGALVRLPDKYGESQPNLALSMWSHQEQKADEEEALRLFYVATTRAKDMLILSAGMDADGKLQSPWMRLLNQRFDLRTGLPKYDPLLGSLGRASSRQEIPEIKVHHEPPQAQPMETERSQRPLKNFIQAFEQAEPEAWPSSARVLEPDRQAPGWWSVSQLEVQAACLFPEPQAQHSSEPDSHATELGTLIHAVLQRMDFHQPQSWETQLLTCVRSRQLRLEPRHLDMARDMLQQFVQFPLAQQLASAQRLYREVDFVLPWPLAGREQPELITGQVDCCYQDASGNWHILDYKTGNYPQHLQPAELLAPYAFQLGVYAWAAEEWFGVPPASVSLVLFRPHVRTVEYEFDQDARERVRHRVTQALLALLKSTSLGQD